MKRSYGSYSVTGTCWQWYRNQRAGHWSTLSPVCTSPSQATDER